MTDVVLGIDIGTSSVKVIAVDKGGHVLQTKSEPLEVMQLQPGYSEQHPDDWYQATISAIKQLLTQNEMKHAVVKGLSFSGQMHSLVIIDEHNQPIRPAILWNDTRSTPQCEQIIRTIGDYVVSNPVLEGFTLTKLLWVKDNEPDNWRKIKTFMLPKDYVRFKLTGNVHMEYSDASSTLLLDPKEKKWRKDIADLFGIGDICPELVASQDFVGMVDKLVAEELGLNEDVAVFAGGGDNACGALGAGIIHPNDTLCSIGTSGVVLSCEDQQSKEYRHNMHYFNHVLDDMDYVMGVTLAAGGSLNWLKNNVLTQFDYPEIVKMASQSTVGSRGLLFTPYLSGERTPHGDSSIRGSFIGLSVMHTNNDLARAVIEGVTYSLFDSIQYLRSQGKSIDHVVDIGGGARSNFWLQLQADVFNTKVSKLKYEEGPSMGAAIIAVNGLGWYESLEAVLNQFIVYDTTFKPDPKMHEQYMNYFDIYQNVYQQTQSITSELLKRSR
ncbi:xylulokinase [Staphylococcus sp. Marseille-Q5304]|uniref:xylulokinase n=1 Tax=Staphylococcus sp. Marseille-Q5304 TaxID=2942200 RepID=UPI002073C847|nr:xylulokinase [Staphylococcus sp. Marseille-Q5304]